MTNALLAIELLSGLLSVVTRATATAARITSVITAARREGRDINDAELAELAAVSDGLKDVTLAKLRGALHGATIVPR